MVTQLSVVSYFPMSIVQAQWSGFAAFVGLGMADRPDGSRQAAIIVCSGRQADHALRYFDVVFSHHQWLVGKSTEAPWNTPREHG